MILQENQLVLHRTLVSEWNHQQKDMQMIGALIYQNYPWETTFDLTHHLVMKCWITCVRDTTSLVQHKIAMSDHLGLTESIFF